MRGGAPLDVKRSFGTDIPAEEIIKDMYSERVPDYLYWGFSVGTSILKSEAFIKQHGIKIIADVGDIEGYATAHKNNLGRMKINHLTARWRNRGDCNRMRAMVKLMENQAWLRDANIVFTPWGIDIEKYPTLEDRPIDVSLLASMDSCHHKRRIQAKDALVGNKHIKSRIGSDQQYSQYLHSLASSKMFVVECSSRKQLVAKYLEGAACGAMLIGEIPEVAADVLIDKKTMAEITDFTTTAKVAEYYLEHDEDRKRIAAAGREAVRKHYNMKESTKDIEATIVKEWEANK